MSSLVEARTGKLRRKVTSSWSPMWCGGVNEDDVDEKAIHNIIINFVGNAHNRRWGRDPSTVCVGAPQSNQFAHRPINEVAPMCFIYVSCKQKRSSIQIQLEPTSQSIKSCRVNERRPKRFRSKHTESPNGSAVIWSRRVTKVLCGL